MQDLPLHSEENVHLGIFKYIFLHCLRRSVKFKILIENSPTKSTKIGDG